MKKKVPKRLLQALRYKDNSKLKKLIRQGHYYISIINLTFILNLRRPLKTDVILTLIEHNKNLNIQSKQTNLTPLFIAIQKTNVEIVKKLLECGADINKEITITPTLSMTPLEYAFSPTHHMFNNNFDGYLDIIILLIKHGANIKKTSIDWKIFKKAVLEDDEEIYKLLLKMQSIWLDGLANMNLSLHLSMIIKNNNVGLLKKFIIKYNILDYKKSLLLEAINYRSYEIVKLLINSGININQIDDYEINGLMLAFNYMLDEKGTSYNEKIIKLLIEKGIDINHQKDGGFTALMIACKDINAIDDIKLLLDNGAKINHQNQEGLTALMCAIKERNYDITKFLIERGADIDIADNRGVTPLMLASWQNDIDIVKLLKKANIQAKDNDGYMAFDYLSLNFSNQFGVLDIFEKRDKYKKIEEKILKIDTNYGIEEEQFEKWIKDSGARHKPKELVKILEKFSSDKKLKYSNHTWDSSLNYNNFIKNLQDEFNKIESDLKRLSSTLYQDIYDFLFSESEEIIGWSSKIIRDEIEKGKLPHNISLDIPNQSFKTFEDAIDDFKSLFVVKQNDKKLKLLKKFTKIKKELKLKNINLNNLKENKIDKFFTDTKRLEQALTLILKDIQENSSNDKKEIVIEADTIFVNDMDIIEIKIIHIGSSSIKTAKELIETINKGNFESIYKTLHSICDWSIETVCRDGEYRIDYLYPEENTSFITSINTPKGFTHILRFYI